MLPRVKTDTLGLLYENLANVDNLAQYWACQSKCSPQYRNRSAPYIGPQVPRTSRLFEATQVIIKALKLNPRHYMPYLNEHDSIMQQQRRLQPPKDMPQMQAYFVGIL